MLVDEEAKELIDNGQCLKAITHHGVRSEHSQRPRHAATQSDDLTSCLYQRTVWASARSQPTDRQRLRDATRGAKTARMQALMTDDTAAALAGHANTVRTLVMQSTRTAGICALSNAGIALHRRRRAGPAAAARG